MPFQNPIVGGRHVSSYSSAPGSPQEGASVGAPPAGGAHSGYNIPTVAILAVALLLLIVLRGLGFRFVVSAGVAGR